MRKLYYLAYYLSVTMTYVGFYWCSCFVLDWLSVSLRFSLAAELLAHGAVLFLLAPFISAVLAHRMTRGILMSQKEPKDHE